MAILSRLYVATLTKTGEGDPGTWSAAHLVVNNRGRDVVSQRLARARPRGRASLDVVDRESDRVVSDDLVDGSIRFGLLGDDQWMPELMFVWGRGLPEGVAGDPLTFPLAINLDMTTALSTDDSGARPSVPVRIVGRGGADVTINRLVLIVRTGIQDGDTEIGAPAGQGESATDDRISLEIVAGGQIVVQHQVPDTTQEDLEGSETNIYWIPVPVPFTRRDVARGGIVLSINGDDAWLPTAVFLFGLDTPEGRPTSIVPLVHMQPWEEGLLSTDDSEGADRVPLTLEIIPTDGILDLVLGATRRAVGAVRDVVRR